MFVIFVFDLPFFFFVTLFFCSVVVLVVFGGWWCFFALGFCLVGGFAFLVSCWFVFDWGSLFAFGFFVWCVVVSSVLVFS